MEVKSRAKLSGNSAKPRATSLGREAADRNKEYCIVTRESLVNLPSSPTKATWDGKFSSRIPPVQGGHTRTFLPSARSECAGGAVRSHEGSPLRRPEETWEYGDVGRAATCVRQSPAAAALVGEPMARQDDRLNFTRQTRQKPVVNSGCTTTSLHKNSRLFCNINLKFKLPL